MKFTRHISCKTLQENLQECPAALDVLPLSCKGGMILIGCGNKRHLRGNVCGCIQAEPSAYGHTLLKDIIIHQVKALV